jgi:signal transduction histidine kinase
MNGTMKDSSQTEPAAVSLERRITELTILHEVSRALQKTVDEMRALYIILVGVTAGWGLGFNRAFILLLNEEEEILQGQLAIGPETPEEAFGIWQDLGKKHESLGGLLSSLNAVDMKKDRWVNELVARVRIPLSDETNALVRVLRSHEACRAFQGVCLPHGFQVGEDLVKLFGTDEFAVAPLFLGDKDLGLLIADNAIARTPIDTSDLGLLEIYAQEASAAIQNTRLYRRLSDQIKISDDRNAVLREGQQQLLQVERLSAMGRLATLLAYRIRAPLASIGGFARRLARTMPPEDSRSEDVAVIVSEVNRLERLVGEVLAYRRISKPEFKPTDVNALIRSVFTTIQDDMQRASVQAALRLQPDLPVARVDELQLRYALMNLAGNALEAMPAGGTLTVATSCDADFLQIEVSDTGTGIPKQNWNKLFKPFFTTKTTGTGLGLAVVSQVVDAHRGSCHFKSAPGEGSSFYMRLAFDPQEGAGAPHRAAAAQTKE